MAATSSRAGVKAWVLLALLFLAYIVSLLDRAIIGVLVEPIKADLGLSDTKISLLQGFAFFIMYSLVGIPMGLLADRVNRVRLIAVGVALWSVMTAVCGAASQYWTLFVGRIGVGIGEATLSPTAYSLLADTFERRRLGFVIGIFSLGGVLGGGLSLLLGGYVARWAEQLGPVVVPVLGTLAPWQVTFMVVGIPGLFIAAAFLLLVEPPRAASANQSRSSAPSKERIVAFLRDNRRVLILHHVAAGIPTMVTACLFAWVAPFFMRVHQWPVAQIGEYVGVAVMIAGVVGLLGGGVVSDYLARRGPYRRFALCMTTAVIGGVAGVAFALVADPFMAAVLFGVVMMCCFLPFGIGVVTLQEITPSDMRGFASAVFIFVVNMLGSAGPTLVALMSDRVFMTPEGLRYSLAVFVPGCFLVSLLCFGLLCRPYVRSLRAQVSPSPA